MKRVSVILFGLVALSLGCEKGTSTAPSTDPTRPKSERRLSVTSPGEQTVTQDKTDEMTISINRDNITGPVDIELKNLPPGVELVTQDMTIPAEKSSTVVTIKASPTATPVEDHVVTVIAKAKDVKDLPEATTTFKLDVKSK
ncbi:MAG: hypothetical protein L0241_25395 [Planctomycetia bacterium]|nr:hypothetical protein [Planctomycetia bacterium]